MSSMDSMNMTSNITDLPLFNPNCNTNDCLAFWAAGNASQAATPWAGQFLYGHWTTWYYLALLFAFTVIYGAQHLHDRWILPQKQHVIAPSLAQKVMAYWRSFAYRYTSGRFHNALGLLSFGMLVLLLVSAFVLLCLTFIARPYYREHEYFGSPPLAIRAGLMAFACCPILVALAGKINLVTMLTGVGHEKLNVIHQWVAWFCLVLSVVHTIPFFVAPIQDSYDNLYFEFYGYGKISATMYSGVPPLAILVVMVVLSLPFVRHRVYEAFYYVHILLFVAFLGLLFWHAGNLLDSWYYLWATLALFVASVCARAAWYILPGLPRKRNETDISITLSSLPGGMSQLTILMPRPLKHTPAQHCFLRIPAISAFQSHPFTIASAPLLGTGRPQSSRFQPQVLRFLIRTRAGLTKSLAKLCDSSSEQHVPVSVWIDGPYGGVNRRLECHYDTLVLVAGGAGITGCIPWLGHTVYLAAGGHCEPRQLRTTRVVLIWVVRSEEHLTWVQEEIERCVAQAPPTLVVEIMLYVSGPPGRVSDEGGGLELGNRGACDEKLPFTEVAATRRTPPFIRQRPCVKALLREVMEGPKMMVVCCGPESMKVDVSNACAHAQSAVFRGQIQEIALHVEVFGW